MPTQPVTAFSGVRISWLTVASEQVLRTIGRFGLTPRRLFAGQQRLAVLLDLFRKPPNGIGERLVNRFVEPRYVAVTSVPLAFVGGAIQLPGQWYKQAVGLVLIFAASRLFLDTAQRSETTHHGRPPLAPAMISGAAIGLLAGLTGTGGDIFLGPLLLFTRWSGTRESGGVSAAFILLNSASGLAGNVASIGALPNDVWLWAGIVIVGGLIGSELGSRRVAVMTFRRLLAAALGVAGLKLLLRL